MAIKATINGTEYSGVTTLKASDGTNIATVTLTETGVIDTPTATLAKSITENGTISVDVTNYKTIEIVTNVSGGTSKTLSSISATYTGGSVNAGTKVSALTGLTVVATYDDGTTGEVNGYTVSPDTISEGSNTITVTYLGKTATFTVEGVAITLTSISAVANTDSYTVGTDASELDITVTGTYSDDSTATITGYEITGTVAVGENTFTISYGGLTCTVTVTGVESSELPDGYELCEWVQNEGWQADAWFTIPYVQNESSVFEFKVAITQRVGSFNICEIASVATHTSEFWLFFGHYADKYDQGWRTGVAWDDDAHEYILSKSTLSFDGTTHACESTVFDYGDELILSAYDSTKSSPIKIYKFKVSENGVTKINLVPCLDASSKACLYDTVSKTTYYAGAGATTYELAA